MGFLYWLNPLNWFRRRGAEPTEAASTPAPIAQPTAVAPTAPASPAPVSRPATPSRSASRAPAPASERCAAVTAQGTQCKSSSRDGSKYCGRHKGYRAASASTAKAGLAAAKSSASTSRSSSTPSTSASKGSSKGASNGQVHHGAYRLYQKGNRYFFSKKSQAEAKADGAVPVTSMPPGRSVVETPNGMPVLKKA